MEGLDRLLLDIIPGKIVLGIINSNSTSRAGCEGCIVDDRYTVVGSVGMLVIHNSSPVVGEVLRHLASGAGAPCANIAFHGGVEGIPADDMVKMRSR